MLEMNRLQPKLNINMDATTASASSNYSLKYMNCAHMHVGRLQWFGGTEATAPSNGSIPHWINRCPIQRPIF